MQFAVIYVRLYIISEQIMTTISENVRKAKPVMSEDENQQPLWMQDQFKLNSSRRYLYSLHLVYEREHGLL